ncbi:MAG: hypothetical protein ABDH49_02140 [Candidatus Hydrothermales bacterium]
MPVKLHYNFKDVFRAARFGLSVKKMWVFFMGLVLGSTFYSIFSYFALLLSGWNLKTIWDTYKLLPIIFFEPLSTQGQIFHLLGLFIFLIIFFIFGTAVSKIHFEQLKGDEFYEIKEALKFSITKGKASFLTPILILILIISILLVGFIWGLISRIPLIGTLIFILFSVPAFFTCLFLVYIILSLIVSLFISASIVGTTGNDTFDTLFEIFSTINEEPWRLFLYELLLLGVVFVAGSIFTFFVSKAVSIAVTVLSKAYPLFPSIIEKANSLLPYYGFLTDLYPYFELLGVTALLHIPEDPGSLGLWGDILGWFLGIFGYALIFMVLSYFASMFFSGNNFIFIALYKKKDEIDLLKEEEEPESYMPEVEEKKETKEETSQTQ